MIRKNEQNTVRRSNMQRPRRQGAGFRRFAQASNRPLALARTTLVNYAN